MSDQYPVLPTSTHRVNGSGKDSVVENVVEALKGLQFGSVLLIVQDGVVVQIERTEKKRLNRSKNALQRNNHSCSPIPAIPSY